ncbi:hypothetical protein ACFVVM_15290 [Nocardia sp. NPDC058176]|uniref:hypothetical protein n=1 Tax=Nocardia sp. NPDC058176 TaxID=3346368 RepID=UPI0036DBE662
MHSVMTNLSSLWEVVLAALLFGAGVPAVFAFAVRWWATAETVDDQGRVQRNHAALAGAVACLVLLLVVVICGVLFTAKAFIAHQFGIHLFGQA